MKKNMLIFMLVFVISGCSSPSQEDISVLNNEIEGLKEYNKELEDKLDTKETALLDVKEEVNTSSGIIKDMESKNKELLDNIDDQKTLIASLESELEDEIATLGPTPGLPLLVEATNILQAIMSEDFSTLSLYVTTSNGLRLSPYQYVDLTNDIVLSPSEVANWLSLPTTYTWGNYDGSGDPITKTADLYFYEFVKDEDYLAAPLVGNNVILSSGNLINNILTEYPSASLVEFYYPEFDPSYGGLDWRSLTLVMLDISGEWYLVGIVHGQWTI